MVRQQNEKRQGFESVVANWKRSPFTYRKDKKIIWEKKNTRKSLSF